MIRNSRNAIKLIPFTPQLHEFIRNEGYTHYYNRGIIETNEYFKTYSISVNGFAIEPLEIIYLNETEEDVTPSDMQIERKTTFVITLHDLLYPVNAPIIELMYNNSSYKFYLMINVKMKTRKLIWRILQANFDFKKIFQSQ